MKKNNQSIVEFETNVQDLILTINTLKNTPHPNCNIYLKLLECYVRYAHYHLEQKQFQPSIDTVKLAEITLHLLDEIKQDTDNNNATDEHTLELAHYQNAIASLYDLLSQKDEAHHHYRTVTERIFSLKNQTKISFALLNEVYGRLAGLFEDSTFKYHFYYFISTNVFCDFDFNTEENAYETYAKLSFSLSEQPPATITIFFGVMNFIRDHYQSVDFPNSGFKHALENHFYRKSFLENLEKRSKQLTSLPHLKVNKAEPTTNKSEPITSHLATLSLLNTHSHNTSTININRQSSLLSP